MAKDVPYDQLVKWVQDLKADNDKLKKDNEKLLASDREQTSKIDGLGTAVAIDAAIKEGFSNLSAMISPLRIFEDERGTLSGDESATLSAIHTTLARLDFVGGEALRVENSMTGSTAP